jgi:hypothetical protein
MTSTGSGGREVPTAENSSRLALSAHHNARVSEPDPVHRRIVERCVRRARRRPGPVAGSPTIAGGPSARGNRPACSPAETRGPLRRRGRSG